MQHAQHKRLVEHTITLSACLNSKFNFLFLTDSLQHWEQLGDQILSILDLTILPFTIFRFLMRRNR